MSEETPAQMPFHEETSFELDRDQLESILLESQNISPTEKERLNTIILDANEKISGEFADIVPPIPDSDIVKKFVFVDKDTMNELEDAWDPTSNLNLEYSDRANTTGRVFLYEGRFVIEVPATDDLWGNLTENNRNILVRKYKTEEKAKELVRRALDTNIIIHESTHLYQIPNADKKMYLLRETQAEWMTRKHVPHELRVSNPEFEKKADFYQWLVDKYGVKNAHECALTGNVENDTEIVSNIMSEFSEGAVKDLFPNLKNG